MNQFVNQLVNQFVSQYVSQFVSQSAHLFLFFVLVFGIVILPGLDMAFVMASAALRGDVVYSGDLEDLERLCSFFPGVRLLSA